MSAPYDPDAAEQARVVAGLQKCFAVVDSDESGVTISWDDARQLAGQCEENLSHEHDEPDREED